MKQLKMIRFSSRDRKFYETPVLEEDIQRQEDDLKRQFNNIIMFGCVISYFSLTFITQLCKICYPMKSDQDTFFQTFNPFLKILFSSLSGFFIDVFSIKSTWYFISFQSIFCLLLLLTTTAFDLSFISIICYIILVSLNPLCIITFTCILYDASCEFRIRLNNAVKFEIYGEYLAMIVVRALNIISKAYYPNNQTDQNILNKYFLYTGIGLSLLMNVISIITIKKTYQKIHKIRTKSVAYQRFQIYQGTGLSLFKILQYFNNYDILYLFAISSICGFQVGSYNYYGPTNSYNSYLLIVVLIISSFTGYMIMKRVNENKKLVTVCFKITSYCLYCLAAIRSFLVIYLQFKGPDPDDLLSYILIMIFSVLQEIAWLILYSMIHQIIIFLLPPRCAIRGIGLSITYIFYYFFYLISSIIQKNLDILYIFSLLHIFTVIVFNHLYLRKTKFSYLDRKLNQDYFSFAD